MSVTFVTSYIEIYPSTYRDRNHTWRIENFRKIANTGIPICLYTCEKTRPLLLTEFANYSNIWFQPDGADYREFAMHSYSMKFKNNVVKSDNPEKDTAEFMALMHAKIDFVWDAMQRNPFKTELFAWMDFNLAHVFKTQRPLNLLKAMSNFDFFCPEKTPDGRPSEGHGFMCMPGCWHIYQHSHTHDNLLKTIHWRFCGGFFLGDRAGLTEFRRYYEEYFPIFMETYRTLVWEVNFWSWLEAHSDSGWRPIWYHADHNDSIVSLMGDVYSQTLDKGVGVICKTYTYPAIHNFLPTSASFVKTPSGEAYLNTRFVNYIVSSSGAYHYLQGDGIIRNKNVLSKLTQDETGLWIISSENDNYRIVEECLENLPKRNGTFSEGLEDVRVYYDTTTNKTRFVASTIDRSQNRTIEIMEGEYDLENAKIMNCRVYESPYGSDMEKNWIPLGNENKVIYRWSPFEIFKFNGQRSLTMEDFRRRDNMYPLFDKIRGSSTLVKNTDNNLEPSTNTNQNQTNSICVVHFSEERWPRHYFHLLVELDSEYNIVATSLPFVFHKHSVEFCIGFTLDDAYYHFWISNNDRDAEYIRVPKCNIPLGRKIVS